MSFNRCFRGVDAALTSHFCCGFLVRLCFSYLSVRDSPEDFCRRPHAASDHVLCLLMNGGGRKEEFSSDILVSGVDI